jgi:toxin-antitoxin system PIN domain toxin
LPDVEEIELVRALLDVNVLIALLDSDHTSHGAAMSWFAGHAREGWASCPITQNGCIRIMSNASYPNALPVRAVMQHLADACAENVHEFWSDEISLLDPEVTDSTRIHGPRQLTDIYLLALAVAHEGRFVTFDGKIPLTAVRRAKAHNLVVL